MGILLLPGTPEAPWAGGNDQVWVCPQELQGDNRSTNPALVHLQVIDTCQADEPFSVDDLALVEILKEGSPNGATENLVTIVVSKVRVFFLEFFQGHRAFGWLVDAVSVTGMFLEKNTPLYPICLFLRFFIAIPTKHGAKRNSPERDCTASRCRRVPGPQQSF